MWSNLRRHPKFPASKRRTQPKLYPAETVGIRWVSSFEEGLADAKKTEICRDLTPHRALGEYRFILGLTQGSPRRRRFSERAR